jgi:hypothetical protein
LLVGKGVGRGRGGGEEVPSDSRRYLLGRREVWIPVVVVCRLACDCEVPRARALCGCGGCAPDGERGRNQSDDGCPTSKDEDTIVGARAPAWPLTTGLQFPNVTTYSYMSFFTEQKLWEDEMLAWLLSRARLHSPFRPAATLHTRSRPHVFLLACRAAFGQTSSRTRRATSDRRV